ncbi:MAG: hypothetical protein DLM68_15645, partial [Hyphomicrobiales bacterium]
MDGRRVTRPIAISFKGLQGLDGDALSRALGRFARGVDAPAHIAIVLRFRSGRAKRCAAAGGS